MNLFHNKLALIIIAFALQSTLLTSAKTIDLNNNINEYFIQNNIHLSSDYSDSKQTDISLQSCKNIVYKTLKQIPKEQYKSLDTLDLFYDPTVNRGQANANLVQIRCSNIDKKELISVLIHELAHVADAGFLVGEKGEDTSFIDLQVPVKSDDPSLNYYKISWLDNSNWNKNISEKDFCSQYGSTNPYEDFAECYTFYVLHGKEFFELSKGNPILRKKYFFIKNKLFSGQRYFYDNETIQKESSNQRPYDITKIEYNYIKFWTESAFKV